MLKNLLPICQQNLSNSIANLVKREKMFLNTKFPSLAHQKLECSVLSRSNTQSSFGEYHLYRIADSIRLIVSIKSEGFQMSTTGEQLLPSFLHLRSLGEM